MTVGTPEYNLDTFGIKYVKKAKEAHESGGDSGITSRTTSNLSNQDIATSGFGDRQNDSKGDTDVKVHNQTDQPKTSKQVHSAGSDRYGVGGTEGATQGGKNTQAMTSSGKLGKPSGKKVGTETSHDSGIKDSYSGQKRDASGNPNVYKKPEGGAGAPIGKARLQLAINKCKLLKLKGFGGESANSRNQKPLNPNSGDDRSFGEIRDQQGTPRPADEPQPKNKILPAIAAGARVASTVANVADSVSSSGDEVEKTTGDKIPHEKLGDLPQGKDDKKVGGTEIEDKDGKSRKLQSPADRYKSEVREMAIDAIDMAMKTIAVYQDAKEKAIQEELIKEAYEAQKEAGATNTSDGGSVNFTYSDIKQKEIKTE
jgi:hypothetical protein